MKRLIITLTAGLMALLSFNSCEFTSNDFDGGWMDVSLTAFYAGGIPSQTVYGEYDIDRPRLYDDEVESIFQELCTLLPPGFTDAQMDVYFYDWMDNLRKTRYYDFFWITEDYGTGRGYYGWEEIFE